jgi:uncharacterized protein YidB (DUF937 family)
MSLLDNLKNKASEAIGKNEGNAGSAGIMGAVTELMQQHGGVPGLMQQFKSQGLGDIFHSWVSQGSNQPISSDQLQNVLGKDRLQTLAEKAGIPPETLSQKLSENLPTLVDKMTPSGEVPAGGFSKEHLLSVASNFFKKAS